jgi:hypothetical protein
LKPLSLRRILWVILLSFISLSTSENMMERSIPDLLGVWRNTWARVCRSTISHTPRDEDEAVDRHVHDAAADSVCLVDPQTTDANIPFFPLSDDRKHRVPNTNKLIIR